MPSYRLESMILPLSPDLTGKVVVITGASSGIGAALTRKACLLGAMVVMAARNGEKLLELSKSLGGNHKALPLIADVTKRDDHHKIFESALGEYGNIDVWINNAGRGISKSILDINDADFDEMMSVNTKSALYGMQEIYPYFSQREEGGHIINISSVLARLPFPLHRSAYCASKHALNSITTSFRLEAKKAGLQHKLHVSLVSPGLVATEFGLNVIGDGDKIDSRTIPGAQSVDEVVDVILGLIKDPRADVYTRDEHKAWVKEYFTAENVEDVENCPPWVT